MADPNNPTTEEMTELLAEVLAGKRGTPVTRRIAENIDKQNALVMDLLRALSRLDPDELEPTCAELVKNVKQTREWLDLMNSAVDLDDMPQSDEMN